MRPEGPEALAEAKAGIVEYAKGKGALAVGVADVGEIERIAPPGHGPRDLFAPCRSVISVGVGGPTQGMWLAPPKVLASYGDAERRAYGVAYGLAYFIESVFGYRAMFCPPDPDPESGTRVPMQSLKLHAELAGIGARSIAGDILLHPDFGFMYYASCFTDMPLEADGPMERNPCPAPSCLTMYDRTGKTPCMSRCPVGCLHADIRDGRVVEARFEMHKCADMTQQYEAIPLHLKRAFLDERDPAQRQDLLYGTEAQDLWYRMAIGDGQLLGQCFECMRVCPIARQAPEADPLRRHRHREAAGDAG